jgi:hypothetical protein
MGLENVPRCQHVKVNGTQCGSPALRRRRRCYFHEGVRQEQAKIAADRMSPRRFDLPVLEDANSVQVSLMKVIQMLGSGNMDHKTAGLILYALQTASVNLRNVQFEAEDVTDIVIDRDTVCATYMNGPQWVEEDFDDEEEEEDKIENDAAVDDKVVVENKSHGEATSVAVQAKPESAPKAAPEVKHVNMEEARKQVRGLARDWLLETAGHKPQ